MLSRWDILCRDGLILLLHAELLLLLSLPPALIPSMWLPEGAVREDSEERRKMPEMSFSEGEGLSPPMPMSNPPRRTLPSSAKW